MLTILHGSDIVSSRNKLTQLKQESNTNEIITLFGEKTELSDIAQAFESQSLFATKRLIILENLIETKDKELVASVLNHIKKNTLYDVIFWEAKEIKKELLALFPKTATVFFFKQERLMFQFLDSIRPENTRQTLSLFHKVLAIEAEELVFYMLVRQFRILLGIVSNAPIDEVKRLAPWQKGKLERQARAFSQQKITDLYQKLFQIEKEIKTGASPFPLSASLDLFLMKI